MIKDCIKCKGTGFNEKLPCVHCNTRGKVSDQLNDLEYSKLKGKTLVL